MELNVIGANPLAVSEAIFGAEFREALVHQVVVAYRNAGRAGTKAQLSRGEISGTTKKFKKQKGGGARHGDFRAPIFVGGGITFAAKPRSFAQKVNRKMYRGALRSILGELNRQGRLAVVSDFEVESPNTKSLQTKLAELQLADARRTILVTEDGSEALYLSARNLHDIEIFDVNGLDPVTLVGADKVVVTVAAVKKIEEWLA